MEDQIITFLDHVADDIASGEAILLASEMPDCAKAALLAGDITWIESQVGSLTVRQQVWINARLSREEW